jgi:hypothetical protein
LCAGNWFIAKKANDFFFKLVLLSPECSCYVQWSMGKKEKRKKCQRNPKEDDEADKGIMF